MRASRAAPLTIASLLALAGCHASVTEVVVVVDTDLSLPAQAETFELEVKSPRVGTTQVFGAPVRVADGGPTVANGALPRFPATIGLVPRDDRGYEPFDVTATLLHTAPGGPSEIVVQRSATGVEFVRGETRTLFLSLLQACACAGTSCPAAGACGDLTSPTLSPFDPGHLPRVTSSDGGASSDGAADAHADVAPERDGAIDDRVEARGDAHADANVDHEEEAAPEDAVTTDGQKDAAPETPTLFPQGHVCGAASDCQDRFCVDGVCCENQCACGTCGGATPGRCVPAAAGTDPHDVCLLYTCDGNGACATTCSETFGSCDGACKPGVGVCNGIGNCIPTISRQNYCVVGTCVCDKGLTCTPQDGGGPGECL